MAEWLRKRSLLLRVHLLIAASALVLAAGVGATAALMLRSAMAPPAQEDPRPSQGQGVPWLGESEYASMVGGIQDKAVEAFFDSHGKLRRYDALTATDVEEMQANEAALEQIAHQAGGLAPPPKYEGQHKVFSSAVGELHEAARMAHELAADPISAAEIGFDEYDSRVQEATALLQRSNEMLGRDYKTTEGAREISPELSAKEPTGSLEVV